MTIERRLIAGIDDIKGVTFECLNCSLRHTVPPEKIGDIPAQCPRCHHTWIPFPPASPLVDLASAIERIRALDKQEGNKPGFRVLLELDALKL
jgi:hypothetical protein